jgi:hypothetical protein
MVCPGINGDLVMENQHQNTSTLMFLRLSKPSSSLLATIASFGFLALFKSLKC